MNLNFAISNYLSPDSCLYEDTSYYTPTNIDRLRSGSGDIYRIEDRNDITKSIIDSIHKLTDCGVERSVSSSFLSLFTQNIPDIDTLYYILEDSLKALKHGYPLDKILAWLEDMYYDNENSIMDTIIGRPVSYCHTEIPSIIMGCFERNDDDEEDVYELSLDQFCNQIAAYSTRFNHKFDKCLVMLNQLKQIATESERYSTPLKMICSFANNYIRVSNYVYAIKADMFNKFVNNICGNREDMWERRAAGHFSDYEFDSDDFEFDESYDMLAESGMYYNTDYNLNAQIILGNVMNEAYNDDLVVFGEDIQAKPLVAGQSSATNNNDHQEPSLLKKAWNKLKNIANWIITFFKKLFTGFNEDINEIIDEALKWIENEEQTIMNNASKNTNSIKMLDYSMSVRRIEEGIKAMPKIDTTIENKYGNASTSSRDYNELNDEIKKSIDNEYGSGLITDKKNNDSYDSSDNAKKLTEQLTTYFKGGAAQMTVRISDLYEQGDIANMISFLKSSRAKTITNDMQKVINTNKQRIDAIQKMMASENKNLDIDLGKDGNGNSVNLRATKNDINEEREENEKKKSSTGS